jgi:hypothetical protein
VDAVVINRDPMIGGLTIVQAKRYIGVIGVSHIRELVGTMDEKRAGRGILVTTSWFASGCWTKASENGRVELIDGPRLRHLVKEHLNKDVLVAPPRHAHVRGIHRQLRRLEGPTWFASANLEQFDIAAMSGLAGFAFRRRRRRRYVLFLAERVTRKWADGRTGRVDPRH